MKQKERKVDVRLLYILPSLLALVIAVTSLAYQFGNELVDLGNTCYTVFISIPEGKSAEEMIGELDQKLLNYNLSGFTINENTQGAYFSDGQLQLEQSLQIVLLTTPKDTAYQIAEDLQEFYGKTVMLQEYTVKVTYIGEG